MNPARCPLCFGQLETIDVAPCAECGHDKQEIEHYKQGLHTYSRVEVFQGLSVVLCNFCQIDFGSYDLTFFGRHARIAPQYLKGLVAIDGLSLGKDKYCPNCQHRLAFLEFVAKAREKFDPRDEGLG